MRFKWEFEASSGIPLFDKERGYGFVSEGARMADSALRVPQLANGFIPLSWYEGREIGEFYTDGDGVCVRASETLSLGDRKGRYLPVWFRVEVPAEGVYEATIVIRGLGGEVLVFSGRRRLIWHDTLADGEARTLTTLCDVFPIVPDGQTQAAGCTGVDITVIGAALAGVSVRDIHDARLIWIMGDSTVTDQTANVPYAPGTSYGGWGQMLPAFLPGGLCVTNHAHSGLSTRTFEEGGHWDIVRPRLKDGDLCLIQFGHNDQKCADLTAYGGYYRRLEAYIHAIRDAKATPVLVTPAARNTWTADGRYRDLLETQADSMQSLGRATGVAVIDLHAFVMGEIKAEGLEASKRWFFPGDFTHTNDFGAYRLASYIAPALCSLLGLKARDLPSWVPQPPFTVPKPPLDSSKKAVDINSDPLASYETDRPDEALTRVEALEMVGTSLHFFNYEPFEGPFFSDIEAGTPRETVVQTAIQNNLLPASWLDEVHLYPDKPVSPADFMAVLKAGFAQRYTTVPRGVGSGDDGQYEHRSVSGLEPNTKDGPSLRVDMLGNTINRAQAAGFCRSLGL